MFFYSFQDGGRQV